MNYPLISEYVEAIKAAEDNFDQLKHLRPVLGEDGEPVMTSGNFAVVFKMKDEQTGKLHAVKCFLKEQEGRAEAYRQIAEELEYVSSTFLTPIKYLDKELFVDSSNSEDSEFPVLLMDWVEGQTLDKYIREHIDDQYELSLLAYQFSRLAMWLMPQPFAHGDLKPDNILVKEDGTLVLVDYDGMYVPAMKGQKARELGSPDFRHPSRTEEVFDDHIDDFSLASILLSLKAIALQPALLEEYGASDRLLFSEKDYRNLSESSALGALQPLMQDAELASLYSLFILALSQNNLSQVSFRLFNLSRPDRSQYEDENLSTEVTEEDLANAWTDEFGVKYSSDGKRLLRVIDNLSLYTVREGTQIICDEAFSWIINAGYGVYDESNLTQITISDSLIKIGENAFSGCKHLKEIILPNSISEIGNCAFYKCESLLSINIPNSLSVIGESVFSGCAFSHIRIPNTIKKIGNYAFYNCNNLEEVIIPDSVTDLGAGAFGSCSSLKHVKIPNSITELGYEAFSGSALTHIELPKSITKIGSRAFWDSSLTQLEIPYSVIKIEEGAFHGSCLEEIVLPESITEIADSAFYDCFSLKQISIPNSVTRIGDSAFYGCSCLSQIGIPDSIKFIGGGAFHYCESLTQITIPDSVVELGNVVFSNCHSLKYITFSGVVNKIGDDIFHECDALDKILISTGTRNKFEELLPEYKDKLVEISNVVSITFDNSSTSKVDRCRVFKKDNDWKLEIVYKNGMKIEYPHSLLEGNQSIEFDKQTIEKIQLYVGYCEGFYINPKAVEVDFEYPSKFSAKILFDSDFIEISGITWGLNNNINEWKVKGLRSFNIEERLAVNRAEVVPSDYGNSVCFFMNAGGQTYIPLDKNSELCVGDALDMNTAKIITLCRKGKSDIVRVME